MGADPRGTRLERHALQDRSSDLPAGPDRSVGTQRDDDLHGTPAEDLIIGRKGDDWLEMTMRMMTMNEQRRRAPHTRSPARAWLTCALLAMTISSVVGLRPAFAAPTSEDISRITAVNVTDRDSIGRFDGVRYVRIRGIVEGIVTPDEEVVGFDTLPLDLEGNYVYTSEFELITPRRQRRGSRTVFVEAENRGNPELFGWIQGFIGSGSPLSAVYPPGFGTGFLFDEGHSYARVQWQTGISPGVPDTAQGVGLVIQRDFGRLLAARKKERPRGVRLPRLRRLVLMGDSQSSWNVNTFVAEGFNRDPVHGGPVYDGAIALNGVGNWLAINQLGDDGRPQEPYVRPNGTPLSPQELLSRPESDPVFVSIAAFTDYFRLRASLFSSALPHPGIHHYEWSYPHASLFLFTDDPTFPFTTKGCDGGDIRPLYPVDMRPYLRTVVSHLAFEIEADPEDRDDDEGLPPSAFFELGPAPDAPPPECSESTASLPGCTFNPLPGFELHTPAVDADAQPRGGVRFPEVALPLGRPEATPLSHTGTLDIGDLCGNFWAWEPFGRAELVARYGSAEAYGEAFEELAEDLADEGYLLEAEIDGMVERAIEQFESQAK